MTVEKFWDKYINEDILEIFDETCEFLSQKLSQEVLEEYDIIEVVLEASGHHETAKNFDNVIKLIDIVQKHQPELYKETFVYLNDFLVEYYFFHQDMSKVDEAFSHFIDNPLEDYDNYLKVYRTLLFYQHSQLLNKAIAENYYEVCESDDIIGGAYDLALSMFYITLQEAFKDKKKGFDKVDFAAQLKKYDLEFTDGLLSSFQKGLSQSWLSVEELNILFVEDRVSSIVILRGYFLSYMHERGFEFYLSGHIWDKMLMLWIEDNKNAKKFDSYFRVTTASFEEYLSGFSDMFENNLPEMIATLWGSVYIYEFLHQLEIISTEVFQDFLKTSQELKGNIIGMYTPDLWRSNFVHHWTKPDSVSEDEFREEHNIFTKSIYFKNDDSSDINDYMSEELLKIGPLAEYIIEGAESGAMQNDFRDIDNMFRDFINNNDDDDDDDEGEYIPFEEKYLEPVRTEPKVGRNDPCTCGSGKKYKKCCGK